MAKIDETNYPRRQASEYAPTDMLIVQPVAVPGQEHSGDSRTTRVSDLKDYILGDADPSKIGTPAAGTYTSASNTNAQNIAALDHALANYDHLTKQIATQAEINGYIADPTTADFNVIYLLKDTSATGSDKYFEYMRLGTPESSTFEMTGDTSTDLSGYVQKSATAGLLKNDGTVDTNHYLTQHQDITGKADKVSSATENNLAALDANGNLKDSGKSASDFVTTSGEAGNTTVTFTDAGADAPIVSGSTLKTIIGLIKYKLGLLLPSSNVKTSYQASPSTGQVYDAAYINELAGVESVKVIVSNSSTAGQVQTAWSSSPVSIAGDSTNTYYKKTITLTHSIYGIPEVKPKASGNNKVMTDTEKGNYDCLDWYGLDPDYPTQLNLYAKTKPTGEFYIWVIRDGGRV